MALQTLTELTIKLKDVRTNMAKLATIPLLLEDKRLQFDFLVRLVQSYIIDASTNSTAAIGKGYTCSGAVEKLRAIVESIATRASTQYGSEGGDKVLVSKLSQEDLVPLLPNIVAAVHMTTELLQNVSATLDSLILKTLRQTIGGNVHHADIYEQTWSDLIEQTHSTVLFANGSSIFNYKSGRGTLEALLSRQPMLCFVSLSQCSLTDPIFVDVLPLLAGLAHLQSLDVSDNALTDTSVAQLLDRLADETAFTRIEKLDVKNNMLIDEERSLNQIRGVVAKKRLSSITKGTSKLNVLVLDGVGMEAAALAKSMRGLSASALVDAKVDLIGASSFASVVAVALAAGISGDRLCTFFDSIATNVFQDFDFSATYGYKVIPGNSLLSAARWTRRWYTGGNYYNEVAFVAALNALFGQEILSMTLSSFGASHTTAPRMLLVTRAASNGSIRVFRTYQDLSHGQKVPEEATSPATTTVLEALQACCYIPGYFAPKNTPIGLQYVDCMTSALEVCLSEAAQRTRLLSEVHLSLLSPEKPPAAVGSTATPTCFDTEALLRKVLSVVRAASTHSKLATQSTVGSFFNSLGSEHLPRDHLLPDVRRRDALWMRAVATNMLQRDATPGYSFVPLINPKLSTLTAIRTDEHDAEVLANTATINLSVDLLTKSFASAV